MSLGAHLPLEYSHRNTALLTSVGLSLFLQALERSEPRRKSVLGANPLPVDISVTYLLQIVGGSVLQKVIPMILDMKYSLRSHKSSLE